MNFSVCALISWGSIIYQNIVAVLYHRCYYFTRKVRKRRNNSTNEAWPPLQLAWWRMKLELCWVLRCACSRAETSTIFMFLSSTATQRKETARAVPGSQRDANKKINEKLLTRMYALRSAECPNYPSFWGLYRLVSNLIRPPSLELFYNLTCSCIKLMYIGTLAWRLRRFFYDSKEQAYISTLSIELYSCRSDYWVQFELQLKKVLVVFSIFDHGLLQNRMIWASVVKP